MINIKLCIVWAKPKRSPSPEESLNYIRWDAPPEVKGTFGLLIGWFLSGINYLKIGVLYHKYKSVR